MLYNEILKYVHIVLCSMSQLVIQKCWEIVEIMENVEIRCFQTIFSTNRKGIIMHTRPQVKQTQFNRLTWRWFLKSSTTDECTLLLHFKKVISFYIAAQHCEKNVEAGDNLICEEFSLKLCIAEHYSSWLPTLLAWRLIHQLLYQCSV